MSQDQASFQPGMVGYTKAVATLLQGGDLARQYLTSAANTSQTTATSYGKQALGYLNQYNSQGQNTISPQVSASYSALDNYFGLLGIPTPRGGSQSIAQLGNINNQLSTIDSQLNDLHSQYSAGENEFKSRLGGDQSKIQGIANKWMQTAPQLNSQISSLQAQRASLASQKDQLQPQTELVNNQGNMLDRLSQTPGYQFALDQGVKGVESSAAAGGYLNSGRTMKDIDRFSQGLATTTYQNAVQNAMQAAGLTQPFASQSANMATNQGAIGAGLLTNTGQYLATNQNQLGANKASVISNEAGGISAIYSAQGAQQQASQAMNQGGQAYLSGFRSA